jgi:PTS system mannose-specific IIC component
MAAADYLLCGVVAVAAGLDRTAALQLMVSRPIVAAPLTGWLLGDAATGLQTGALLELLWLGRLPVGAAIPPDDTQIAVGGTTLAVTAAAQIATPGPATTLLCLLVALPLGKVGRLFDHLARLCNGRLLLRAEAALATGDLAAAERSHLRGLAHFALAALATFAFIVAAGSLLLRLLVPLLLEPVAAAQGWLRLVFPLAGAAALVGTLHVRRAGFLFAAAFGAVLALLCLWGG